MTHPNPKDAQAELREAIEDCFSNNYSSKRGIVDDLVSLFQAREQDAYKKGYIDGSTASAKAAGLA